MKKSRGKYYWLASLCVAITGTVLILKFPPNGFYYAFMMLFSFWIAAYVIGRIKTKN